MRALFFLGLTALGAMDWNRFQRALDFCGIRLKEAAICMGISPAQLSRQMRGQEHMHVDRLWQLPDEFHRVFAWLTLEDMGVPAYVQRAEPVRKRMASMSETSVGQRGAA